MTTCLSHLAENHSCKDNSTECSPAVELHEDAELDRIRDRIRTREAHQGEARDFWLQDGRDLLLAKEIVGHGEFDKWRRENINFSASKALKLMQAAAIFGDRLKNVTVTNLPSPTLCYLLAAPSCPQAVFDAFYERVLAGEKVGSELRNVLKQHRAREASRQVDHERSTALRVVQPPVEVQKPFASSTSVAQREYLELGCSQSIESRSAAVALIVERFGAILPNLLEHAAQAGVGSVFNPEVERELQASLRADVTSVLIEGAAPPETAPLRTEVSSEEMASIAVTHVGRPVLSSPRSG